MGKLFLFLHIPLLLNCGTCDITFLMDKFDTVGNDSAMLEQALAMSMNPDSADQPTPSVPDFGSMSEEEQIAYAMQMSLANSGNFSGCHKKKSTHL